LLYRTVKPWLELLDELVLLWEELLELLDELVLLWEELLEELTLLDELVLLGDDILEELKLELLSRSSGSHVPYAPAACRLR